MNPMTELASDSTPSSAPKSTWLPWIVCLTAGLFFFYEFIQMNMFNAISVELMRDFGVKGTDLGNLSAMYLYGDVVFLFPAGILLDRFSVRRLILIAMGICILSTVGFALSTHFWTAAFVPAAAIAGYLVEKGWGRNFLGVLLAQVIASIVIFGGGMTVLALYIGWQKSIILGLLPFLLGDSLKMIFLAFIVPTLWKTRSLGC